MRLNLESHRICVPLEEAEPLPPEDARVPVRAGGLEMLYRMHKDRLLRFLERRGTPDQAADIVQRLFARLAFDRDDVDYYFPTTMQFNGGRNFTLGIRANF